MVTGCLPAPQLMLKDFLGRKERGELKLDAYNRKLARGLQPVRAQPGILGDSAAPRAPLRAARSAQRTAARRWS